MQKALPTYKEIKTKYKKGKPLAPLEIARGIVFLLIEELDEPEFRTKPLDMKMLQDLVGQSKLHTDIYDVVYYTTTITACIRCLVHERRYWLELLNKNVEEFRQAARYTEQVDTIETALCANNDKNVLAVLNALKKNIIKHTPKRNEETSYRIISSIILLRISAIYKFAEIIGEIWELPELVRLFYADDSSIRYETWAQLAIIQINSYPTEEKDITLDDIQILPKNAETVRQLLLERYLDISRINPFIDALKEGIGLTVSGGQHDE